MGSSPLVRGHGGLTAGTAPMQVERVGSSLWRSVGRSSYVLVGTPAAMQESFVAVVHRFGISTRVARLRPVGMVKG